MNDPRTTSGPRQGGTAGRWLRRSATALGALLLLYTLAAVVLARWAERALRRTDSPGTEVALSWEDDLGSLKAPSTAPGRVETAHLLRTVFSPRILSVHDAEEVGDDWILLDRRGGRIHTVDISGGSVESRSREGMGPGELHRPVAMAVHDTLLWLVNRSGFVLDRFSRFHGFQGQVRIRNGACPVGLVKDLAALESGRLVLLRFCPPRAPGAGTLWLEHLDPSGAVEPFLSLHLAEPGDRSAHPFRMPVLASRGDDLFLGTLDAPCLLRIDPARPESSTGSGEHLCVPDYERPTIPDSIREAFDSRFGGLTRLGFAPPDLPGRVPWLDGIFATSQGVVVRRFASLDHRELVHLDEDGKGDLSTLQANETTFVGHRTILVARDRLQGTELRIYESPWR